MDVNTPGTHSLHSPQAASESTGLTCARVRARAQDCSRYVMRARTHARLRRVRTSADATGEGPVEEGPPRWAQAWTRAKMRLKMYELGG